MNLIYKFEKKDLLRYTSHLDLQRLVCRALRRAQLPVEYTQGFHPLPVLNFAQALAVGASSQAEYMQVRIADVHAEDTISAINAVLPQGLRIIDAFEKREGTPSLMAAVAASRWSVSASEMEMDALQMLMQADQLWVERQGKGGLRKLDIRPGILDISRGVGAVQLLLRTGSALNIRPMDVYNAAGLSTLGRTVHRIELYAQEEELFVALEDYFRDTF